MAMLQKLARRIGAKSEDVKDRWKFLLDLLGTFRTGGRKKKNEELADK